MNSEIYQDMIIEHYKNPVNIGTIPDANAVAKEYNSLCGDEIEMQVKIIDGKLVDVKFNGHGCAISQSSTDILIETIKNKNIDDIKKFTIDDFLHVLGIELSPLRLKCALLGLKTLKTAVYSYASEQM